MAGMDTRRAFLSLLLTSVALPAVAGPRRRAVRRVRRRVYRHVYRRWRRRVAWRVVAGRRIWVAPVALAVGWELALPVEGGRPDEIVVVRELREPAVAGGPEIAVVVGADGKTREMEFTREDNADNGRDLEGSVVATPGNVPVRQLQEEVEEEVDE